MARPRVFFDITANDKPLGRVIIELRDDVVPRTAENFRQLCTGEKGFSYKGSNFYKILQDFSCEGGDVTNNNGSGGKSIYGKTFDDENFTLKHITGSVSMVSSGRNTNNSKFFILGGKASWLDGKQVVFGQVWEDGMDVVRKMAGYGSDSGKPKAKIVIADCGQL